MKRRKLKTFVLPTLYVLVIGALFISIALFGTSLQNAIDYDKDMAVSAIKDDDVMPVVSTENEAKISKPYNSDSVAISKQYYDMKDDELRQQQSLVYYENTYLQNSGTLYSSDEEFEVLSALDGKVTKIDTDNILGNLVEITHNHNLKTVYYSLSEVNVALDDEVKTATVIGKSGNNKLENEKDECLLFEVYYNGSSIDPEDFYNMEISELQ